MRPIFKFFLVASVFTLALTTPSIAQDSTGKSKNSATKEVKEGTRIIISTSGPAKFSSHWLESPPRLIVEFQTRNIISKIGNEITVDQGVIKRIATEYFGSGEKKLLKSLTFELTQKVPYKIWQEADTVILDIQTPQEISVFPEEGREIFAKNEPKEVMFKRLGAMDTALTKVSANHLPLGAAPKLITEFPKNRRKTMSLALLLIGLTLISGLGGLLFWLFWRRYKLILDKNVAVQEIEKLKSQVAEKNKFLEQEEIIRKTIENTSLTRERDFEQLKLELQKETKLLEEEGKTRMTLEEALSQKEKESEQVKNSLESLKEVLVNKGLAKKISSPEGEGELWIPGKSSEKRLLPRLDLSRDYNRTIILRIESPDKSKSIKSFANNIGLGGLCFETRKDFEEKEAINLRLFFFGDKVPMMRMQAKVIWSKIDTPVNRYGISFTSQEEKDKTNLSQYIESKITRG
jgi:hypothetical protein